MVEELTIVGRSVAMKGSGEKVTGTAEYTVDMKLPGMIYGKILRSPHAHANIRGIDTSRAEALPGVRAVITHEEAKILYTVSHGSAREYGIDDCVRYYGDKVAAVAAVSEEVAEEALSLIDVDYEVLPAVLDGISSRPEPPVCNGSSRTGSPPRGYATAPWSPTPWWPPGTETGTSQCGAASRQPS